MSYHFVTGDFTPQKVFLPDKEYGLALDALVKGCADVLLTRGEGASLLLDHLLHERARVAVEVRSHESDGGAGAALESGPLSFSPF